MKSKTIFYCTACGNETPRWQGRCPACGAWNTMVEHEEKAAPVTRTVSRTDGGPHRPRTLKEVDCNSEVRFLTGLGELDRVLGGGAVTGSLVLVGGAPGIGKSTLLLQICAYLGTSQKVLYVSGEESETQIKMRAQRLGVQTENLFLLSETDIGKVLEATKELKPDVLIADSIQTLYSGDNTSSPGSISQVKDCTMALMQLAKGTGVTVFVVSHMNKEGSIAGPRVLEHMRNAFMRSAACTIIPAPGYNPWKHPVVRGKPTRCFHGLSNLVCTRTARGGHAVCIRLLL